MNSCDKAKHRKGAREILRETKRRKQDERNVARWSSRELVNDERNDTKQNTSQVNELKGGNGANAFDLVVRVVWK